MGAVSSPHSRRRRPTLLLIFAACWPVVSSSQSSPAPPPRPSEPPPRPSSAQGEPRVERRVEPREELYAAAERAVDATEFELADRLLTEHLDAHPQDADARGLRARVRSWSGRWQGASEDYATLLDAEPRNVDYLLGSAQVLLWSGSPDEAAAVARTARELAPDYEALWRVELQALLASADAARRQEAAALARQAQSRFPSSAWSTATGSEPEPYLEIAAGVGRERLSNGFDDWSSTSVAADYHFGDGRVAYGRARATERFGIDDTEAAAGAYLPIGERWVGMLELTSSPSGEVLPEYSVTFSARRALPGGWGVGAGIRRSQYAESRASLQTASVDRYWRDFRFSYQLYRSETEAAGSALSHSARADYYYGDGRSVALAFARGKELESIGGGRLISTKVEALTLLGEHRITPDWALTWTLTRHEQGAIYRREGVDAGFRHRF